MRPFEHYLAENMVKCMSPDPHLGEALHADATSRLSDAKELDPARFSKIVFETCYDALRDLMDSLLAIDGFKSYSHQASIAYLSEYRFDESDIYTLDHFRHIRNASKYYGRSIPPETAHEILSFTEAFASNILGLIEKRLKEIRSF